VAEAGARQHERRVARVFEVNRDPRGNELRVAGLQLQRRIDAGAQIDARRPARRVLRQGIVAADAWIEDADFEAVARGAGVRSVSGHVRQ
jgi:hypothetical protein